MLAHCAIFYSSYITKIGNCLNDKIFSKIILIQSIALNVLPDTFREKMRFTMKNEIKIHYGVVLENFKLIDSFKAKKISKHEM